MNNTGRLSDAIHSGAYSGQMNLLYGKDNCAVQQERYLKAIKQFETLFADTVWSESDIRLLSVPGRSEVGGNHTDHNHGRVLACAIDLDIIAITCKNNDGIIRIKSDGYTMDTIEINVKTPQESERYHSSALIRGVCVRLAELGYQTGGFDAYTTSRVLKGSGLSSSAAFEIMVANIINHLYNDGMIDPVTMAKVSQFAEKEFFGKPCGLMDQTACAVGGFITIDFANTENPVIEKLNFDFDATGNALCIVDTGGNHADLNDDYASIQGEMKQVARLLGHKFLGECDETEFYKRIKTIRSEAGDRAVLRAIHFFGDNARVLKQAQALKEGDFETFQKLIIESGRSSFMYLQNAYSIKDTTQQGLPVALALAQRILDGCGAWRVHGGGFAGTIQAFVPSDKITPFVTEMSEVFGESACYCLKVREKGAFCFTR